jgi:DNA polymerase III epsilon subunit-like protein
MNIPTIIDIEASGFGAGSYPIEVGVARADGAKFCRLIKPYDDWIHWQPEAQALHGLSRADLMQYGVDGHEVCIALNEFLNHQTAYSDGWVVDNPWLIKLYTRACLSMKFRLSALEYILNQQQMDQWTISKRVALQQMSEQRHRASADAELIQRTYILSQGGDRSNYQAHNIALSDCTPMGGK